MSTSASATPPGHSPHTIDVRLANRPGALYRLLGVVGRHQGNVERLVVAPTDDAAVSHVMLVVRAANIALIVRQMRRLLPVLAADTHTEEQ